MVYDLSNAQIALAQTVFNSTAEPNVIPFASSGAPIPSAKAVVSQVTVLSNQTTAASSTATVLAAAAGLTSVSSSPSPTSAVKTGSGSASGSSSSSTASASATGGNKKSDASSVILGGAGVGLIASLMVMGTLMSF